MGTCTFCGTNPLPGDVCDRCQSLFADTCVLWMDKRVSYLTPEEIVHMFDSGVSIPVIVDAL